MAFQGILSLIIFLPLLGAAAIVCIPSRQKDAIRVVAAVATGLMTLLSIGLYIYCFQNSGAIGFNDPSTFQLVERVPWIRDFGVHYYVGIDGFSSPLVILSALLSFLAVFVSWKIENGVKGYFLLLMLLSTSMTGVFCSLDFFLFYVFWEVMLLPMYFLIGVWGGPRKEYAAIKFFLYTLAGSILMLVAMIYLYLHTNDPTLLDKAGLPQVSERTFDLFTVMKVATVMDKDVQWWLWIGLFVGFAIKVPIFPFHTWLPDAHVEAPTAISVILAGILLKMGTYGLLRFNMTMLPEGTLAFAEYLAWLGVINVIYGAMVAMAQTDFKKLVAYSSISHMGYVLLGLAAMTPMSLTGAALQMFNHGTSAAMMFMIVGVIYDRAHHRDINGFGGLGARMPLYYGISMIGVFAALGLPGLSGFVSEVFVLLGSYETYPLQTILSCAGIILTAAYLLWAVKRVYMGRLNPKYTDMPEINGREIFCLAPLCFLVIVLGVFPHFITKLMAGTCDLLSQVYIP